MCNRLPHGPWGRVSGKVYLAYDPFGKVRRGREWWAKRIELLRVAIFG